MKKQNYKQYKFVKKINEYRKKCDKSVKLLSKNQLKIYN